LTRQPSACEGYFVNATISQWWGFHGDSGGTTDGNCSAKGMNKSWRNIYHLTEDKGPSGAEPTQGIPGFTHPRRHGSSLLPRGQLSESSRRGLAPRESMKSCCSCQSRGHPYLVTSEQPVNMVKL